jgi:predicted Rossmann fold nucleotide-binding protein DprA/Smf involved in DNA uptake
MSQIVLVTGSRDAMPEMLATVDDLVSWAQRHDHVLMCGDAAGVDAAIRKACHRLGLMLFVYGGYKKIRGPNYPGEQPSTVDGNYLTRDRVMAEKCNRGIAIMRAPKTGGTWYTGRYVENLGKRVRWAVWDDVSKTWSYYDRSEDIPRTK